MDKAELIRHEIEKRKDHNLAIGNPLFSAMAEEDIELLCFIDSLQEEPVSEDLEKELSAYVNSKEYINSTWSSGLLLIARHFAKWQRKQDQSTIELAEDHAMFAGMEKMREQMMKDAIPANILTNQYGNKYIQSWSGLKQYDKYKNGDEVKIIIIKKE